MRRYSCFFPILSVTSLCFSSPKTTPRKAYLMPGDNWLTAAGTASNISFKDRLSCGSALSTGISRASSRETKAGRSVFTPPRFFLYMRIAFLPAIVLAKKTNSIPIAIQMQTSFRNISPEGINRVDSRLFGIGRIVKNFHAHPHGHGKIIGKQSRAAFLPGVSLQIRQCSGHSVLFRGCIPS